MRACTRVRRARKLLGPDAPQLSIGGGHRPRRDRVEGHCDIGALGFGLGPEQNGQGCAKAKPQAIGRFQG